MPIELRTILFGATCGLTAGFAPGPLLALVVSQTMKYDFKEGLKVAIVPVFTDVPIVLLALLLWSQVAQFTVALAIISFVGSILIARFALDNFKVQAIHFQPANSEKPKSFRRALATNFFQPHPYVFWFGVGTPAILVAWKTSHVAAVGYLVAFLGSMISAKIFVALLVKKSKGSISQTHYRWVLRGLGILMLFFSLLLIRDGFQYLGIHT